MGMAIALFSSLLTAGLAVMGTHYLNVGTKSGDETQQEAQPGGWQKISNFFSREEEAGPVQFVEINNIVITLRSEGEKERYMLLELALTAVGDEAVQQTEQMLPAIRGATVVLLSDMEYRAVRTLSISDLHDKLMAAYVARFEQMKKPLPFKDVTISKMLLQ